MTTLAVLIHEKKNKFEQVRIDISKDPFNLLKGPATFIGQWSDINVVIMKNRTSIFDLCDNENRLAHPFEKEHVKGPILLVRMDENAEPQDFTLEEFLESKPCR